MDGLIVELSKTRYIILSLIKSKFNRCSFETELRIIVMRYIS